MVQSLCMIFCSIVVILQGVIEAKGPENVVRIAEEHGRLNYFKYVSFNVFCLLSRILDKLLKFHESLCCAFFLSQNKL